jgi:hypothetical protein
MGNSYGTSASLFNPSQNLQACAVGSEIELTELMTGIDGMETGHPRQPL